LNGKSDKRKAINFSREHHIDWLRTLSILSLIPFHVFAYHAQTRFALKTGTVDPLINYLYYFLEQWRLCLLFFISGYCSVIYLKKYSPQKYIKNKVKRILVPLFLGSIIIIPPQVYLEKIRFGLFQGSFIDFIPHIFSGIYPQGNSSWGHLWFLFYLFVYMFVFFSFYQQILKIKFRLVFLLFPLLIEVFMRPYSPSFPNFITDYANVLVFGFYFYLGLKYKETRLDILTNKFSKELILILSFLLIMTPLLYEMSYYDSFKGLRTLLIVLILPVVTKKSLSFNNRFLEYFKLRNYAIYIIHHTVIIIIAERFLNLNPYIFAILVTLTSLIATLITVEIFKSFKPTRYIIGMQK